MNLILLGAPGAGKGTLASYLIEKMGVPSVSTGNILREAIANGTELGQKAKAFMDAGQLVPDSLVIDLLKNRIAQMAPILTQLNELADLTEHYYDRGYWRNEKYTQ